MLKNKSFEALIEGFNAHLKAMTENGYPIHDTENPEFFISRVFYNPESDQIEFQTRRISININHIGKCMKNNCEYFDDKIGCKGLEKMHDNDGCIYDAYTPCESVGFNYKVERREESD